jgi:hypothetical protein
MPELVFAELDAELARTEPDPASRIVWFDAFVSNVDRTVRNTNMLMWHRRRWLIDHGATLSKQLSAGFRRAGWRRAIPDGRGLPSLPRILATCSIDLPRRDRFSRRLSSPAR